MRLQLLWWRRRCSLMPNMIETIAISQSPCLQLIALKFLWHQPITFFCSISKRGTSMPFPVRSPEIKHWSLLLYYRFLNFIMNTNIQVQEYFSVQYFKLKLIKHCCDFVNMFVILKWIKNYKYLLTTDAIDLLGCPDEGGHRAVCWRLLLNYLPPHRSMWSEVLSSKRELYKQFVGKYL